jgi:hypothetical protein
MTPSVWGVRAANPAPIFIVPVASLSIRLIAFSLALSPITISMTCMHRRMNSFALTPMRVAHSLILACSRGLILMVIRSLFSMAAIVRLSVFLVKRFFACLLSGRLAQLVALLKSVCRG